MRPFIVSLKTVLLKPVVIGYVSIMVLAVMVANRFNPIFALISGYVSMEGTDTIETIISFMQFLTGEDILPAALLVAAAFSLMLALLTGLLLSGYFNIINNTLYQRKKNSFIEGFRKIFFKIFFTSLKIYLIVILFFTFMIIASVPMLLVMHSSTAEKPVMVGVLILIILLTAAVLFFGLMFLRTYLIFWIPAILNNCRKPFRTGKKAAEKNFWRIVGALFMFDLILVVFSTVSTYFEDTIYLFAAKWAFYTIFFTFFSVYAFAAFKVFRSRK